VDDELSGKHALVTGGSRGLGLAISLGLAARGAEVIVASRKEGACIEAARRIQQQTGRRAIGMACHVGRWADCDSLVERAYAEFGKIDILVSNAGMAPLYPSLAEVDEELWDKVLAVNLKGPFRLAALIGTRMAADGGGAIITVSSTGAVMPQPVQLPYGAAKAALNAMTIGLARAFGPTVRANVVMPGPFLTDVSRSWDMDDFARRAREEIPLGRGGQPDEIVGAVLYLAGPAASYTTGAVVKVDGGNSFSPG
jgi:NAD(P)-dependent dehydrogenase (short-subunit alcohol dehydrogenase family)